MTPAVKLTNSSDLLLILYTHSLSVVQNLDRHCLLQFGATACPFMFQPLLSVPLIITIPRTRKGYKAEYRMKSRKIDFLISPKIVYHLSHPEHTNTRYPYQHTLPLQVMC